MKDEARAAIAKANTKITDSRVTRYADSNEISIADGIGGELMGSDSEVLDVVKYDDKGNEHGIEVKTICTSSKIDAQISMKPDQIARKMQWGNVKTRHVHTIVDDHRDRFEGGSGSGTFSGHQLYYKRGLGNYRLSSMYKVRDHDELKRLIEMKDHELPDAALGKRRTLSGAIHKQQGKVRAAKKAKVTA
jgi:hypothetical protein